MPKTIIHTDAAPKAIGPYSQATRVGNTLWVSGQTPLDPATGKLVPGGVEEQTAQVMKNLAAIVEAAGFTMADVVQTQVLLTDMADFQAMNGVYALTFPADQPARATYAVKGLPLGARVEILLVAAKA